MILEVAILHVRPGTINDFERDFRKASPIMASMQGYIGHELHKCVEVADKYMLLVKWRNLSDHLVGFRQSDAFASWQSLLHAYYDPAPTVEHYLQIKL